MKNRSTFTLALLLAVAIPTASRAQGLIVGAHGGFDAQASEVLIGGTLGLSLGGPISITSGFDFYPGVGAGISLFIVDFDVNYAIPAAGVSPWVGAGLFLSHTTFDLGGLGSFSGSSAGLNVNAGLGFGTGPVSPFVEAKLRAQETSGVTFRGGIKFALGR